MLRPQGYVQVVGFRQDEYDTVTCGHCNQVVLVKPGTASTVYLVAHQTDVFAPMQEEAGAMCRVCMTPVCLKCHGDGRCTPLMRRIEAMEGDRMALARLGMS